MSPVTVCAAHCERDQVEGGVSMGFNKNWSLTLVRHYQPSAKKIDVATFYFGRDLDELSPGWRSSAAGRMLSLTKGDSVEDDHAGMDTRKLPSALISMLDSANLTDVALESGFHIEMSIHKPSRDPAWVKFQMLVEGTSKGRGMFGRTRHSVQNSYVESDSNLTMEFVPLVPEPMPTIIWAKVSELPPSTLAGVIAEGMLCPNSEQTTLDEFMDLGFEDQICRVRELVLPGPDWDGCC